MVEAKDYWNLANAISAAAFIQMMAYFYALGEKREFHRAILRARPVVMWVVALSWVPYAVLLSLCAFAECSLTKEQHALVTVGYCARLFLVACTTGGSVFATKMLEPFPPGE